MRRSRKKTPMISLKGPWGIVALLVSGGLYILHDYVALRAFPTVVYDGHLQAEAYFTPQHACQKKLITLLDGAQHEILVMCYSFTAKAIGDALIRAQGRGVKVRIIADASQQKSVRGQIPLLHQKGVPIWIDHSVAISHNKVMIIDDRLLVVGSYNFSEAAEKRNAENMLCLVSPGLAKQYKTNWIHRQKASRPLTVSQGL